ncbi:MAG TPA: hypothetical protein DCM86_01500 [Verrucomicrobiales bacterium]|nr:hypothetical protein [Verrucomicrobiales bacterium]
MAAKFTRAASLQWMISMSNSSDVLNGIPSRLRVRVKVLCPTELMWSARTAFAHGVWYRITGAQEAL